MRRLLLILIVLASIGGAAYWYIFERETDWAQATLDDVSHIYQALHYGHPGSVDTTNPEFRQTLETAHLRALDRASTVTTAAGHFYTKRAFTVAFQDVHVGDQLYARPERDRRWPGFATALNSNGDLEVFRRDAEATPPVGATLISCDAEPLQALFERLIAPFCHGSWLTTNRGGDLPYILLDSGNPFVEVPTACTFEFNGSTQDFVLNWEPASDALFREILDHIEPVFEVETGLRLTYTNLAWVSIASFNDSDPAIAETLADLRNDIETRHSQIAAADAIVLDVRGNNGGATSAGQDVAAAIWGRAYVNDHRPTFEQTEWRASEFNLELVNGFADQIADAIGADAPLAQEVATIRDGIRSAVENGNSFFIQTQDQVVPTGTPSSVGPIPVILLTHGSCVSACLDFVDLVMAFDQSLHVGAETGGDTRYLEVVYSDLPSGKGRIAFPTAIHRGRDRGDNVTYVPSEDWSAEITNTPVLEARISQLVSSLPE